MNEQDKNLWCRCCGEKAPVCCDTDLGLVCGDCAHDIALATVVLIHTPGIAPRVSTEADR